MTSKLIGETVLFVPHDEPDHVYPMIIVSVWDEVEAVSGWVLYDDGLRLVTNVRRSDENKPFSWHLRESGHSSIDPRWAKAVQQARDALIGGDVTVTSPDGSSVTFPARLEPKDETE